MADGGKPRDWYFGVECATCGKFITIGPAASPQEVPQLRTTRFLATCPHCQTHGRYRADQVQRRQGIVQ